MCPIETNYLNGKTGFEVSYVNAPNYTREVDGVDIVNVEDGFFHFGRDPQQTILGSCVSIIIASRQNLLAGLSCIVGRKSSGPFNYPNAVLNYFQEYVEKYSLHGVQYCAIGGSDSNKWILDMVLNECKKRKIDCSLLDVLGSYHRQVLLIPEQGKIQIYKKER
jgi:chemotaxis receptor (MCP) glutamine deamidase CheD